MSQIDETVNARRPGRAARLGMLTLIAGTLDLLYAFTVNAAHGVPPGRVLQYIASGLLGASAFLGGVGTAQIGALAHYALMAVFVWTVGAVLARPWVRRRHPVVVGALAGAILYGVMTFVVVPLSRTPTLPPMPPERVMLELAVHVLILGPVVAIVLMSGARADRT